MLLDLRYKTSVQLWAIELHELFAILIGSYLSRPCTDPSNTGRYATSSCKLQADNVRYLGEARGSRNWNGNLFQAKFHYVIY